MNTIKEKAENNIEKELEESKVNSVKEKLNDIFTMKAEIEKYVKQREKDIKKMEKYIEAMEKVKTPIELRELDSKFYDSKNNGEEMPW